jgi:hypothetical protein
MENELKLETTQRLPVQAAPVVRTSVGSGISGDTGLEASDMDHINIFKNCP